MHDRVYWRHCSTWKVSTAGLFARTPDLPTAMCVVRDYMEWPGMVSPVRSASSRVTDAVSTRQNKSASGPHVAVSRKVASKSDRT